MFAVARLHLGTGAFIDAHPLPLHSRLAIEHPARAQIGAGQRLVEAPHRAQSEQRLDRAHVQRHLKLSKRAPPDTR